MARWKVLQGVHQDKNAKLVKARPIKMVGPDGSVDILGVEREPDDGVFYGGDIIETDVDLSYVGGSRTDPKFERIGDSGSGLDSMTIAQLREFAAEEEIDLGDAAKRDEILRLCQGEAVAPV